MLFAHHQNKECDNDRQNKIIIRQTQSEKEAKSRRYCFRPFLSCLDNQPSSIFDKNKKLLLIPRLNIYYWPREKKILTVTSIQQEL
jgi:hypothetical protein